MLYNLRRWVCVAVSALVPVVLHACQTRGVLSGGAHERLDDGDPASVVSGVVDMQGGSITVGNAAEGWVSAETISVPAESHSKAAQPNAVIEQAVAKSGPRDIAKKNEAGIVVAKAYRGWRDAGLSEQECEQLADAASVILTSWFTGEFEPYQRWMAQRGARLASVAQARADHVRRFAFRLIPDDEWNRLALSEKWSYFWSHPEMRGAVWGNVLLDQVRGDFGYIDQEMSTWTHGQRSRGWTLFMYDGLVEHNEQAMEGNAKYAWLHLAATFHKQALTPDGKYTQEVDLNETLPPVHIRITFTRNKEGTAWMPWELTSQIEMNRQMPYLEF